ncbi:unnamed protein product [Clonostachys rosea f. rosea IK726]|uniref:Uncharacterized protein n=1 Tax=Clonostachys rosea f. rosea IK726 TaxID=1349383 RepID=A0ACA9TNW1_BIOOC|nr:unnamed protein product [Clonostachys rosea f. rosea IK726]
MRETSKINKETRVVMLSSAAHAMAPNDIYKFNELRTTMADRWLFATPVDKGALSQIWAAVSPEAQSGRYYGPVGKVEPGSKASQDHDLQEKLFEYVQNQIDSFVPKII